MPDEPDSTGGAARALVVDDDPGVRRLVVTLLCRAGLRVEERADGAGALEALGAAAFDVIVLDVGLPRIDGWHVLERIRAVDDVPVLMLTGHASEIERVRGLRSGADDYVAKPFGRMELVARVEALLRRRPSAEATRREPPVFDDGRLRLDALQRRVWWDGEERRLSATEFRLLAALVQARDRTLTQDELAERLWGEAGSGRHAQLRAYIGYVRRKLGHPEALVTVHGVGYRYTTPSGDGGAVTSA